MSDDEPQNPEADWHFTHAEMMAHDAALLEAQSTELALCKTRARWVQVVVAELNADLDRIEAERDAARATIIKAHDVWAGSWQFGLEIEDRIMLSAILSRGAREAAEPWTDPAPYLNAKTGDRYAYRDAWPSMVNLTLKPRTRSQYDAEEGKR